MRILKPKAISTTLQTVNASKWEEYQPLQERGLFLQSSAQKELFERLGQKTWLLEYKEEGNSVRSLVTKIQARRGNFLFLPYGPLVNEPLKNQKALEGFFSELKKMAREEGASFIRVSPHWKESKEHQGLLSELAFRKAPIHMLAETLWIIDLEGKTEEELLQGMEKKHRNLVRRAEKDGVSIRTTTDKGAIDQFWELYAETAKRHQFVPYPKKMLQGQLELFSKNNQAIMFEAIYEGKVLASAMIMYYGNGAAYHHGASSSDPAFRKIPASYLLQWEAIKEGLSRGSKFYNFWGIAPYQLDKAGKRVYENPKHPFCGITHFKTGFGGKRYDLMPCHDLIINSKYYLTWGIEKGRKWKRGF